MSHFKGLVFGNLDNLERYSEYREVEPYVEYTKEEGINKVKKDLQWVMENDPDRKEWALRNLTDLETYFHHYFSDRLDENDNVISTYNPESKWDWYCEGGRFSGLPLINRDDDEESCTEATVKMVDWDSVDIPFCVVTPDGEWHEEGNMGWFALVSNENENWDEDCLKILKDMQENYPDETVYAIDFHI